MGAAIKETSPSAASGEPVAAMGEVFAADESAARESGGSAKLAPSAFSGCGEARSSADCVFAGDCASGECEVNMAMTTS